MEKSIEKKLTLAEKAEVAYTELIVKVEKTLSESYPDLPNPDFYRNKAALLRFLTGYDLKVEEAYTKWKNWVDWRLSYKPEAISENEECIQRQKEIGKLEWYGHDKDRRPSLYYKMKNHKPGVATTEETIRYFVFMLEKGLAEADRLGSQTIVVIYDRRGYSKKNHDPKTVETMKKLTPILQDYYPERLHIFFVIGANWFYRAMYAIVKNFLSEKTTKKVCILPEQKDLLRFFDIENLLPEYGGAIKKLSEKIKARTTEQGALPGDDLVKSESEDEGELKKLADKIYEQQGVKPNAQNEYQ